MTSCIIGKKRSEAIHLHERLRLNLFESAEAPESVALLGVQNRLSEFLCDVLHILHCFANPSASCLVAASGLQDICFAFGQDSFHVLVVLRDHFLEDLSYEGVRPDRAPRWLFPTHVIGTYAVLSPRFPPILG